MANGSCTCTAGWAGAQCDVCAPGFFSPTCAPCQCTVHGVCNATIAGDGTVRDGGRIVDRLPLPAGTQVQSGALETSTVNPIGETLAILTAQRAFETAQKTMLAIDGTREKAANDVGRLK